MPSATEVGANGRTRCCYWLEECCRSRAWCSRLLGVQGSADAARAGGSFGVGRRCIRVNTLHPNAVFDTGLWTEEVLKARAESYGLSIEAYKRNNVLKTEVRSVDVGELAAELCGPAFAKTTGAQVPVDGGDERVI